MHIGKNHSAILDGVSQIHANASIMRSDISNRISSVARACTRKQLSADAQKVDRQGKRCLRNLTETVIKRASKGGNYASLVQEDPSAPKGTGTPLMKVTSEPKEVASGLVKQFYEWMGGNKTFWFTGKPLDSNSPNGKSLRKSILDGTLSDLGSAGIPVHFTHIVEAFKRVHGATSDLYKGLLDEISPDEWNRKVSTTKKGTTPGLSREIIDMLASLSAETSSVFRRVINLVLRSRRVFSQWLRRAICPIPKVPGNPDVKLSRPLTLLSVSGKVF